MLTEKPSELKRDSPLLFHLIAEVIAPELL